MWGIKEYEDTYHSREIVCKDCEEHESNLKNVEEYFSEVRNCLYGVSEFNKEHLDHCMIELCYLLKVSIPKGELKVDKERTLPDFKRTKWTITNTGYNEYFV